MQFRVFADRLSELENISSRLRITEVLAGLYGEVHGEEVAIASYLLQGRLVPAYESLEFQLSSKMIMRVLARLVAQQGGSPADESSTNLFGEADDSQYVDHVQQQFKKTGDLGTVTEQIAQQHRPQHQLTLTEVYYQLRAIAEASGEGSQELKVNQLADLLTQLDATSAKFVVRIVMGQLRLGFATMTMLDALSWTMTSSKAESSFLEDAYQKRADIGELAAIYLAEPDPALRLKVLTELTVKAGVPVVPALCQRLNSAQEMIAKMNRVIVEPKYDGVRVQIHIWQDERGAWQLKTFTRSLEESTHQFPELARLGEWLNATSAVLDGEAIGYDKATGKLLPFQETITRKRKHEVAEQAAQVPLRFFMFDVLSIDGQSLLNEKLRDRKELLKKLFKYNEHIVITPYIEADQPEEIQKFHTDQLAAGLEGVVVKQLESVYQSGRKGWSWVKMKEAEGTSGKLLDTIDAVVLGYYVGRGKRAAFGVGAFLIGVLDAEGAIKTIAKIGTGLSDDQFRELKTRADALAVKEPPALYTVDKNLVPDVWMKPQLVVEIAADEVTKSPNHTAGVALRFPRLVRFRDDKKWQDATTIKEVTQL